MVVHSDSADTAIHPELSHPSMQVQQAGGMQRFGVDPAEPQGKHSLFTWVAHQNQSPSSTNFGRIVLGELACACLRGPLHTHPHTRGAAE